MPLYCIAYSGLYTAQLRIKIAKEWRIEGSHNMAIAINLLYFYTNLQCLASRYDLINQLFANPMDSPLEYR